MNIAQKESVSKINKLFLLIGFLLLIQLINAEITPLTIFSDKEYLGENNWKFTSYSTPQYYFNDLNNLNKIDSNFVNSTGKWDYNVTKGLYSLGVKDDGTFGFKFKNKGLTLRFIGIGFYNTDTKQFIKKTGLQLSNPIKEGNKIEWNLQYNTKYKVIYENKKFKDVLEIPQEIKNYLWNNKPDSWNASNTWFGLIFDVNLHNIQLNNFDSNKRINVIDENTFYFSLPSAKVYHENHYTGIGDVNNEGKEWQKKRVYFNGKYIEAIPISALQSENGKLIFNATIQINVNQSSDDAQDTLLGINLTNNDIIYSTINQYDGGVIFQNIDLPQGQETSESLLNIHFTHNCGGAGNCSLNWYGADTDDIATWSSGHKPSSETPTTATVNHFNDVDFTSNATYASTDLNVTTIVQEIFDRAGWDNFNNLGFLIKYSSFGRAESLNYKTFDYENDSWTLTIEYEGAAPNPCQPQVDQNWIHTSSLYCYSEDTNIGSGNLIIDTNGFLGLFTSSLKGLSPFIFIAPQYWKQQYTYDSNISTDSDVFPKLRLAHNPTDGLNPHGGSTSAWLSGENSNDHWVQADLGETHYCRDVLFPIMYRFNWFTDVNARYYDGTDWHLLYDNTNFQTTDCNELWDDGSVYYCDLNLSINNNCQKVHFQVEHDSKEAGAVSNNNSTLGMNNILIYDKYDQQIKLTLHDSNFMIKNN